VARQLIVEGVLLSLVGATGGILLSYWACAAIARVVFEEFRVPAAFDGTPDLRVVALTAVAGVAAGIVCASLPAWRSTRGSAAAALRADARTMSRSSRTGQLIVATQVALSLVLLTSAGLLIRSLSQLRAVDTGIERSGTVFVAYPEAIRPGVYASVDNDSYYREVLARIEALPGVTRASISLLKPGTGGGFRDAVIPIDATSAAGVAATRSPVAPAFFEAVGIRIITGRDFDWRDSSRGQPVTILSESLARRLFGARDPIGQHVRVGLEPSQALEVIGVAADARLYDLKDPDLMAAYTPALQDRNASLKCFVIRANNGLFSAGLPTAVEQLGLERVGNVVTLRYITDRSLLIETLTASISSFFGSLVLLLAGVGLFGLMSQSVTQRRKEIGIRMTVGADRARIVGEVVRSALMVTLSGVVVGVLASLGSVQLMESLVFGIRAEDPITFSLAAASLVLASLAACAVPAWRASRIDPLIALRAE
jgi:predicted permease